MLPLHHQHQHQAQQCDSVEEQKARGQLPLRSGPTGPSLFRPALAVASLAFSIVFVVCFFNSKGDAAPTRMALENLLLALIFVAVMLFSSPGTSSATCRGLSSCTDSTKSCACGASTLGQHWNGLRHGFSMYRFYTGEFVCWRVV